MISGLMSVHLAISLSCAADSVRPTHFLINYFQLYIFRWKSCSRYSDHSLSLALSLQSSLFLAQTELKVVNFVQFIFIFITESGFN